MSVKETNLGLEIHAPHHTLLFGGKDSSFANLQTAYPKIQFVRVKQVHGNEIALSVDTSTDLQINADAHITKTPNLGLCIATADCVPVLIFQKSGPFIAAIHAGWRGVANKIIPMTVAKMNELGVEISSMEIYIGPHIQQPSFEVGHDVREEILATLPPGSDRTLVYQESGDGKSLVDLNKIVLTQLSQSRISSNQIHNFPKDTFRDLKFHSHRRDKEKAGRQLSFICRHE